MRTNGRANATKPQVLCDLRLIPAATTALPPPLPALVGAANSAAPAPRSVHRR
jgi:hypothetical protein